MKKGDRALIYHSGDDRAVVGTSRVSSDPVLEPDPKKPGEWYQVKVEVDQKLPNPLNLGTMKKTTDLKSLLLLRQSRLSVMPVSKKEYECILKLAGLP